MGVCRPRPMLLYMTPCSMISASAMSARVVYIRCMDYLQRVGGPWVTSAQKFGLVRAAFIEMARLARSPGATLYQAADIMDVVNRVGIDVPSFQALVNTIRRRSCAHCGAPGARTRCAHCDARYCSIQCQDRDWTQWHQHMCVYLGQCAITQNGDRRVRPVHGLPRAGPVKK